MSFCRFFSNVEIFAGSTPIWLSVYFGVTYFTSSVPIAITEFLPIFTL